MNWKYARHDDDDDDDGYIREFKSLAIERGDGLSFPSRSPTRGNRVHEDQGMCEYVATIA